MSMELENQVIGSMINSNICLSIGVELITSHESFRSVQNQLIYRTISEMSLTSQVVDVFTVRRKLQSEGHWQTIGDQHWEDVVCCESEIHVFEKHLEILKDKFMLRVIKKLSEEILAKSQSGLDNAHTIVSEALVSFEKIMSSDRSIRITTAGKVMRSIQKDVMDVESGKQAEIGIPCGFDAMGEEFKYSEGDLTIIGARPSMGKSAFMIQLIKNLCVDQKIQVGLISLEMGSKENLYRLLGNIMDVDTKIIEKGFYRNDDRAKFYNIVNQYQNIPLYINDTFDIDYVALRANIMTLVKTYGCRVIFIDHLGLVGLGRLVKEFKSVNDALGQVTRMLKLIASELRISVVAMHQLSRSVEERKPPRPMLSDLRSSGNIEQDANKVLFLYRPDYYAMPGEVLTDAFHRDLTNITEVSIAKNRSARVGHWYFHTDKTTSKYTEATEFNEYKPTISKSQKR